jgi:hypothetical protein
VFKNNGYYLQETTMLYNKTTALFAALFFTSLLPVSAIAAENTDTRTSKSISYNSSQQVDKSARDKLLEQADSNIMPALNNSGYRVESTVTALHISSSNYYSSDYSIYNTTTELISDFDHDGFYHRFSVDIDIDTVYDTAYVYAVLYLSYEGGPWNHYATSNAYHIHGDSELDHFIIETELADGFPPGYYDIRIEVYDADNDHWLLSYGPYDNSSLSALPLEDSYYDDEYAHYPVETEIIVAGHGHGSMSWLLAALVVLLFISRRSSIPFKGQ